ncbi:ATP-binding cassette subfamily B protein [Kineosphaera limosa]|uniref:Putative ABC transporter permease/ATP-binding protein n=1 Tax=Kineosphaera limosa NBRC 100340 TaxID=1184609 RepID=K6XE51_9MICO|nr:ABC transporter ATP-binding protein [Kineosphaera limosa]NYE00316.1 ATP-binding cassette subfamily B protein [Kineosphaera limosa]GAB97114.1 putative ABC transporter permease/ATP-binding protein [Kineosphaera limosa NBRC 100340]
MLSRLLRTYLARYRGALIAVIVLQFVAGISGLFLPSLNADIIDNGVAVGDTAHIWAVSVWMLGFSLVQVFAQIGAVRAGAHAAMGMGADVRAALLRRVMSFSSREVAQFGAPSLITRNTNDVQQIQQLVVMGAIMLVAAPITMVGGVIMALREDVGLSWLVAVSVPVLLVAILLIIRKMVPLFRLSQTRLDNVNRVLREQITGIRVVRAFVREEQERERFAVANNELTDTQLGVGRLMVLMFPIVMLVMNVSTVAVLWFGAHRIDSGDMQVGALFAYISYLIQILMSVMMATMVATMIPRASVSAERIMEVLQTSSTVVPPSNPTPIGQARGLLELRDVSFTYPGADSPVLCDISFTARPGTVTAIIGSTGSGKTTLVNLLPRLFDATGGSVRLDGVDVREIDPEQLWRRVGLVPQRPYLFSGTVASNLRYGNPDATDEQLWRALEIAQAASFVQAMDGGLEASIAQGGTNVSGGQRQRLCIARALVAQPELYLFDDSFSALDLATDARLRAALKPYTADATVVIVAQRVSTIEDADQIVVLEAGRIVGLGRHEELLATCTEYQQIVESQLAVTA